MKILFLLFLVPLVTCTKIINTNSGPVRGTSVAGKRVEAFLGIPFAEPPVRELRFAKPVPKSPWKETYDANEFPPGCIQADLGEVQFAIDKNNEKMSEDCLHLNLWVPEGGSKSKTIMVFIHGGAFMVGSSNWKLYDGAALAERGDVIVASMNYRVGTLGFFAGFTDEAPGSVGMYDQVMAIQWIKDNAKHFGGDPDNIVLFGESAGAFSVSLHMISPLSKNLFKRSILLSGSTYHPMYNDNNVPLTTSQTVASKLGCASDEESLKKNPEEVVDCLKRLPAEKFPEVDLHIFQTVLLMIPRVGDDFLPETPIDLYQKGQFKDNEVLIGVTKDEGSLFTALQRPDIFGMFGEKVDVHTFDEKSAKEIMQNLTGMTDQIDVFQSYLDRAKDSSRYSYLDAIKDVVGDLIITCGPVFQAEYQSQKNVSVYFYKFDYRSAASPLAEWMGVAHFDDLQYLFGTPLHCKRFTEFEKEFSRDMMDMFVAFAKTGSPNIPGGLKWPHFTAKDPKYYILGQKDGLGVRPDDFRCDAWRNFFQTAIAGASQ